MRVEIQDRTGVVHEEFSTENCIEAIGNYIDGKIKWKAHQNVKKLSGKPVKLRILLKDANLYSFHIN